MTLTAVIGGTGLNQLPGLEVLAEHVLETPYGALSQPVVEGRLDGVAVMFLPRHGVPHAIAPHRINYRANLWALSQLGVTEVIAVNAVGGILPVMTPGDLVLPDQIIDYTWGREHSFFDAPADVLLHVDFTHPYDVQLHQVLLSVIDDLRLPVRHFATGTYAATQGPRLESAAEIEKLRRDGATVVGMTGMPEAALARELDLAYASICMVVNLAAGLSELPITLEAMRDVLERDADHVRSIIARYLLQSPQTG